MKKDIYIIRNDLNNKVYIGQSVNTENRFKEHCRFNNMQAYIDKEISHLGKEHFWYEILESQIENYDEREIYWIDYYNSIYPAGYNIAVGGNGMYNGTKNISSLIKNEKILNAIINDLQNTEMSYKEIAKKYSIENDVLICRINTGTCYRKSNLNYPIRKERASAIIKEQQEKEIKFLLKTSCLSFAEIANKYNISQAYIKEINVGKLKKDPNENYPIRKGIIKKNSLTDNELEKIYNLLIYTKLSMRQIAKQFNRSIDTIRGIKNGSIKAYQKEKYNYPLRPNNFKKPVSTISAKESTTTIDT